jgi:hypothetical protein
VILTVGEIKKHNVLVHKTNSPLIFLETLSLPADMFLSSTFLVEEVKRN